MTKINDLEKSLAIFTFFFGGVAGVIPRREGKRKPEGLERGERLSPLFLLPVFVYCSLVRFQAPLRY
jgi:hypothetical protein